MKMNLLERFPNHNLPRIKDDKTGQFYLLAAIIIISLLVGLLLITNYSSKKEDLRVYYLGEELKAESARILDYGAASGIYPWDDFTKNFTDYAGKDIGIVFIVGDISSYEAFYYNESGLKTHVTLIPNGNIVSLTLDGTDYEFALRPGENFYFVMYQNIEGERYVARN